MEGQNHVACHKSYCSVRMSRTIIKELVTSVFSCSVAFACRPASELSVAAMVGSVDLEYHAKDPTISCIILISSFESGDNVSSGVGRCTFRFPYSHV